jgi:NADPH:quinone reductase-like Zn-dependent oxidoreductase
VKRILKWTAGIVAVLVAGCLLLFLVAYFRSTNDCEKRAAGAAAQTGPTMKAITYCDYGEADVLRLEDLPKPVPKDDQVLVRVRAASVNPLDWHFMLGKPLFMRAMAGLRKPEDTRLGVDYSGTVEAVGKNVTRFKPGDDVFGGGDGAFAQYVVQRAEGGLAPKPANVSFEQAAAVPIAGITALQSLRDRAQVHAGQKVLINGASGGVGTFAVQIAKSYGALVTGVCSGRNAEMVRALGADAVIDYTKEDFTLRPERYDVVVDNVGNRPPGELRRALTHDGTFIMVGGGGPNDHPWLGPMGNLATMKLTAPFVSQKIGFFMAQMKKDDLQVLADLMASGKVTPVIDRKYPLSETAEAMRYLMQGHAHGKVVITVD